MKIIFECCLTNCSNTLTIENYTKNARIILPQGWARLDFHNTDGDIVHNYICNDCLIKTFQVE